ncbi:MAG TPA: amidohydrolase/deacetylase family metallohydrolase [Terriglobia bacterium]|nr:amidohydrolase/deacetylase family metallohydrolase [Terriglobia bacterium]
MNQIISNMISRRDALAALGGSLLASAAPPTAVLEPKPAWKSEGEDRYDLLIKGGRVIDPSQDIDSGLDVAVRDGKIARLSADIPASQARRVIEATGKIVTPGVIDLHTHVFPYAGPYGIEADPHCVHKGVTTVVDAGTSGCFTFPAFRRYDIESASTRIRALLHVVSIGMVAGSTPNMGELEDLRYCVPKLAVQCAKENRDVILGFKIRFSAHYTGPNDVEGMKRARETADEAGLPLMCHIAGPYSPLHDFLRLMKKGDIMTHCFNDLPHGILDANGKVKEEVWEARRRGVRFDVGHGAGSFSFDVAGKALEQGFPPDTISTDLYSANVHGPVYDMPTTLSKFLLLGMELPEIIRRTTVNAVQTFDFGVPIGTLKPGAEGDVSVFEMREGSFTFTDSYGKTRQGRQKISPVVTVRGGKVFYPAA